jgi:predicted flap endonuclease-1-like 5' DNA nuclease
MGERDRKAVEVIGDVARKAKDAVMVPVHGAFAFARAVVGNDEERDAGEAARARGKESETKSRSSETGTNPDTDDSPTSGAAGTGETEASTASSTDSESDASSAETEPELDDLWGVGASRADELREADFDSVQDVADASTDALTEVSGIGESTAEKMIDSAGDLV